MDLINSFGRASPGFSLDSPTGLGQVGGSLHFNGIRASRIRFGLANRIGLRKGCYIIGSTLHADTIRGKPRHGLLRSLLP